MLADGSQCDPASASPRGGASPIPCISYQPSGPRFVVLVYRASLTLVLDRRVVRFVCFAVMYYAKGWP